MGVDEINNVMGEAEKAMNVSATIDELDNPLPRGKAGICGATVAWVWGRKLGFCSVRVDMFTSLVD